MEHQRQDYVKVWPRVKTTSKVHKHNAIPSNDRHFVLGDYLSLEAHFLELENCLHHRTDNVHTPQTHIHLYFHGKLRLTNVYN